MRIFRTLIWEPSDFISVILSSSNDNLVYLCQECMVINTSRITSWDEKNGEDSDGIVLSEFHKILHLYSTVYF